MMLSSVLVHEVVLPLATACILESLNDRLVQDVLQVQWRAHDPCICGVAGTQETVQCMRTCTHCKHVHASSSRFMTCYQLQGDILSISLSRTLTHASMFAVACGACIDASNQSGVVWLCPNSPFPPQRSERTLRIESSLAAVARNCGTSSFIGPPRSVSAARHQLSTG